MNLRRSQMITTSTKHLSSAIGVKYSHRNDDVLLPSRIEEERSRTALEEAKKQRAAAKKLKSEGKRSTPQQSNTPEPQSASVSAIKIGLMTNGAD
ncbi:hypothetical protein BDR04DRAFT_1097272 [Suillus decipiens]|nr:hypothetical protein BDR04DRAFT_1097272 [Suillus decipiens]